MREGDDTGEDAVPVQQGRVRPLAGDRAPVFRQVFVDRVRGHVPGAQTPGAQPHASAAAPAATLDPKTLTPEQRSAAILAQFGEPVLDPQSAERTAEALKRKAAQLGAIKEIREIDPNAHIVVLTTYDGDEDIYRAIKAGAKAYLLKDTARDALVDTVRRVHAGETYLPPQLAAKLAERVSGAALSQREMEVLQRMAAGKSNKEIGAELFISDGTVKTHVKSIFTKLDVVSRTEAVATATRRGLIQL